MHRYEIDKGAKSSFSDPDVPFGCTSAVIETHLSNNKVRGENECAGPSMCIPCVRSAQPTQFLIEFSYSSKKKKALADESLAGEGFKAHTLPRTSISALDPLTFVQTRSSKVGKSEQRKA